MLAGKVSIGFNQEKITRTALLPMASQDARSTGEPVRYSARPGTLWIADSYPAHVDWLTKTAILEPDAQQQRDFLTKLLDFIFHGVSWGGRYRLSRNDIQAGKAIDQTYGQLVDAVGRNEDEHRIRSLLLLLFANANAPMVLLSASWQQDHVPRSADAARGQAPVRRLVIHPVN